MKTILTVAIAMLVMASTVPMKTVQGKRSRPGERWAPESILHTPSGTYKRMDLEKILRQRNPFKRRNP